MTSTDTDTTAQIAAHEQALRELLERVFQSPLKPLQEELRALRSELKSTQDSITKTNRTLQMETEETLGIAKELKSAQRTQRLLLESLEQRLSKLEALEKIDAAADRLSAAMAASGAGLSAQLDAATATLVQRHDHHASEQRAMVDTTLRQPLEQQLAALQKRVHWLGPLCALSLATTLAVLAMLALH